MFKIVAMTAARKKAAIAGGLISKFGAALGHLRRPTGCPTAPSHSGRRPKSIESRTARAPIEGDSGAVQPFVDPAMIDPSAIHERFTAVTRDLNERARRLRGGGSQNRWSRRHRRHLPCNRASHAAR